MGKRFRFPLCGLIFVASVSLTGCPPVPSGTGSSKGSSSDPSRTGGRSQPARKVKESTDPSSLEAFRRGMEVPSGPMKDIHFEFDRSSLQPEAREILKVNAGWLKSNRSVRVEIEGHADERGTNEYNLALGARRAQSAKDFLATLGIAAGRLSTMSYGEELPVCRDKSEACWQKNRRAHFVAIRQRPSS